MIKKIAVLLILTIGLISPSSFATEFRVPGAAASYDPSKWQKEPEYIDRAFGKFTYGVWNFMMGWMQLARKPYEASVLGDNLFVGIGKGIAYSIADMAGGAANALTFPITALKIPIPEGGIEAREF